MDLGLRLGLTSTFGAVVLGFSYFYWERTAIKKLRKSDAFNFAMDLVDEHDVLNEVLGQNVLVGKLEPFKKQKNVVDEKNCKISVPLIGEIGKGTLVVYYEQQLIDGSKWPAVTKSTIKRADLFVENARKRYCLYEADAS